MDKQKVLSKVTLYLMTQKGFEVLKALINRDYTKMIGRVIVGRDSQIKNDFSNNIIDLCKENNIPFYHRGESDEGNSEFSIAISWRWLIPTSNSKLIVIHDSLLPKYRGFAPLVNMLLNKESKIGATALFASEEYDKGPIISQQSIPITYPIRIADAIDAISNIYIALVLDIFENLSNSKTLNSTKQVEEDASYSLWRDEDDYCINWNRSAEDILHFIHSVSLPYKGASSTVEDRKLRILDAEIYPDVFIENRHVGKVIFMDKGKPVVVCGKGLLKINHMLDDKNQESAIPLKKFRSRFR